MAESLLLAWEKKWGQKYGNHVRNERRWCEWYGGRINHKEVDSQVEKGKGWPWAHISGSSEELLTKQRAGQWTGFIGKWGAQHWANWVRGVSWILGRGVTKELDINGWRGHGGEIDLGVSRIEVSGRYDTRWTTKGKGLEREKKETKDKSYSLFIIPTPKDYHFSFCGS